MGGGPLGEVYHSIIPMISSNRWSHHLIWKTKCVLEQIPHSNLVPGDRRDSFQSFCIENPGESRVLVNTRPESRGDYEQEAKQIPPGHKLLNGKLVRSLDSNSPIKIKKEKIGKKYLLACFSGQGLWEFWIECKLSEWSTHGTYDSFINNLRQQ